MVILGIETSCDETSAAVVNRELRILANVVLSQTELHQRYGGIVPELASRRHITSIIPTIELALEQAGVVREDLDAISVTEGPGLAGSLLVGVNVAKTLAYAWGKPLVPVNHLEGHIYANWLTQDDAPLTPSPTFPLVCLVASGGHTELLLMRGHGEYELLGRTLDDAAGEAFDKSARLLNLGYPGGPAIQNAAAQGRTRPGGTGVGHAGNGTGASAAPQDRHSSRPGRAQPAHAHATTSCCSASRRSSSSTYSSSGTSKASTPRWRQYSTASGADADATAHER